MYIVRTQTYKKSGSEKNYMLKASDLILFNKKNLIPVGGGS